MENEKRERPTPSLVPDVATLERRLAGLAVVKYRAGEIVLTAFKDERAAFP
jgi:hypothetical protein